MQIEQQNIYYRRTRDKQTAKIERTFTLYPRNIVRQHLAEPRVMLHSFNPPILLYLLKSNHVPLAQDTAEMSNHSAYEPNLQDPIFSKTLQNTAKYCIGL